MGNLASSLSLYAATLAVRLFLARRKPQNIMLLPTGHWLTLPALLVVSGGESFFSFQLLSGLEDSFFEKDGVESARQMEHAASKVKAYLGSSDMESRSVLRRVTERSGPVLRRPVRRHSL